MSDYRSLTQQEPRPPTWAEREREDRFVAEGIADVYLPPDQAPDEFWNAVQTATLHLLASETAVAVWNRWVAEMAFAFGWPEVGRDGDDIYRRIMNHSTLSLHSDYRLQADLALRISSVEHLMDVVISFAGQGNVDAFVEAINERARHYRVGLRIEGQRFVPITSEHIHEELVQPTLMILAAEELRPVDELYRKAFDRVLGDDPAGAITAASSAVEEMLRVGLGVPGSQLGPLSQKAKDVGWLIPATQQMIVKLAALRDESDNHTAGTDDAAVATYAVHTAAAILRYLFETRSMSPELGD
jgi:hypothetical protein